MKKDARDDTGASSCRGTSRSDQDCGDLDGGNAGCLSALGALLRAQSGKGMPPVENWNPPYCGEIGMKIDVDGTWYYQNSPIGRQSLVKLFASVLRRDDDDAHYLVTPVEKIAIDVADVPFLAVEMEVTGEGRAQKLTFRTNVDDVVCCGRDHALRFEVETVTQGLKPYLRVRGRLDARITRALYYDLVELAVVEQHDGKDMLGLWSEGEFFTMASAEDLE